MPDRCSNILLRLSQHVPSQCSVVHGSQRFSNSTIPIHGQNNVLYPLLILAFEGLC